MRWACGCSTGCGRRARQPATFRARGWRSWFRGAVALAKITSEDPFAGLPEEAEFGTLDGDLALYFEDVNEQAPAERIELARRCEAAAMAYDTRIQNSGGGDFDTATAHKVMVNSRGFAGEFRKSYCGFSVAPIAHDEQGTDAAELLVLQRADDADAREPGGDWRRLRRSGACGGWGRGR